jgi:methyl-accepting chemotaxis protein
VVTERQKTLVQQSFAAVLPIADDAAKLFYAQLFELDPSLKKMFRTGNRNQSRTRSYSPLPELPRNASHE